MFGNFIVYLYIRMNASNCPWKQIMPSWRPSLLAIWARRRTYAGVRRHELWKISEAASMNEHSGGDPFQSKEKTKGCLLLTLAKPRIVLENRGRPQTARGRGKKTRVRNASAPTDRPQGTQSAPPPCIREWQQHLPTYNLPLHQPQRHISVYHSKQNSATKATAVMN